MDGKESLIAEFGGKDKVQIILEEYKSLRTEILQRNTVLNQIYAGCGAAFVGIVGLMLVHSFLAGLVALQTSGRSLQRL